MKGKTLSVMIVVVFLGLVASIYYMCNEEPIVSNQETAKMFGDSGMQTFLETNGVRGVLAVTNFNGLNRVFKQNDQLIFEGKVFGAMLHTDVSTHWVHLNIKLIASKDIEHNNDVVCAELTLTQVGPEKKNLIIEYSSARLVKSEEKVVLNIAKWLYNHLVEKGHIYIPEEEGEL